MPQIVAQQDLSRSSYRDLIIHVFACGHGDTILVRLADRGWALVDCHLPNDASVQRFKTFLDKNKIQRLEFIVLTHPDFDHYAGMPAIIEHFTQNGRSIGFYADAGVNHADVEISLNANTTPNEADEYARLQRTLIKRNVTMRALNGPSDAIKVNDTPFVFIPIAPEESNVIRSTRLALLNETPEMKMNSLSVVMVLQHATGPEKRYVLMAADAETQTLEKAVSDWERNLDPPQRTPVRFELVKVPHHGSRNGHSRSLCSRCPGDSTGVAVISVGRKHRLPKAEVLQDYIKAGWDVLSTTTRHAQARRNHLVEHFSRAHPEEAETREHDICIQWNDAGVMQYTPQQSRVSESQLKNYYN